MFPGTTAAASVGTIATEARRSHQFGDQVLSPPSTPIIVVAPTGEVVDQHFGIRRSGRLVEASSALLP